MCFHGFQVQIVSLDEETSDFVARSVFDHPYPTTKIMWIPDTVSMDFIYNKYSATLNIILFFVDTRCTYILLSQSPDRLCTYRVKSSCFCVLYCYMNILGWR